MTQRHAAERVSSVATPQFVAGGGASQLSPSGPRPLPPI